MAKYTLEYLWLDGYEPVANIRGKTQIKEFKSFPKVEELPWWGFDGSSTRQAEGRSSDCMLKPVAVYPDVARGENCAIVMCEVYMPDKKTPHPSNGRANIPDDPGAWFGFEQEYFFYKDGRPLGFPTEGDPAPQGPYYTGVGFKNVGSVARQIVEEHLDLCLAAGINHEGINAEVAKGQWEFQIFGKGSKSAADQMWVARYIMSRLCEKYGIDVEWRCKPIRGPFDSPLDWNGSGMHSNFSTKHMREVGGKAYFEKLTRQQAITARAIFAAIQKKYPKLELVTAWNKPMLKLGEAYIFGLSASSKHLLLAPFGNDILPRVAKKTIGLTVNKRTIQVPLDWNIDTGLLYALINARLEELR